MRIAHTVSYAPHMSGLYETTREIVVAECAAGDDSRAVDPTADILVEDRGMRYAPRTWMEEADILVSHSGVGRSPEGLPPIVSMLHGTPHYCFSMEHYHGIDIWRKVAEQVAMGCVVAFVTWQQNIDGWAMLVGRESLYSVSPPLDLDFWSPAGDGLDCAGNKTNVVITDRWRPTKDSFGLLAGFSRYAESHPKAMVHLYGAPEPCAGPLASVLNPMRKRGILGNVCGDISAEDLRAVYRSADVVMTSDGGTARTIREAMGCGCPVITGLGSECGQVAVNTDSAAAVSLALHAVLDGGTLSSRRVKTRKQAEEMFDPTITVRGLRTVYERVLKGYRHEKCVPTRR